MAIPTISKVPVIPFSMPPGMGSLFTRASNASIDDGVTSVNSRRLKFLYPFETTSHKIRKRGIMAMKEKIQTSHKAILSFPFRTRVELTCSIIPSTIFSSPFWQSG